MKAGLCVALVLAASCSSLGAAASDLECYDAKIRAKPLAQFYTPIPEIPGAIVMSWPWFIDLKVRKVLEGEVVGRKITILAVLHSAYPSKTQVFLLRRNTAGTFNLIREDPSQVSRCQPGTEAATPYLRPANGQTLDDARREAEKEWRRDNEEIEGQ